MDKQDKPLSEWTLGEVQALCEKRNGDGCCDDCPFANVIGNCTLRVLPEEWDLKEVMNPLPVDTEREGLGPSPTGETEAPRVDAGAGSKPARPRLAEVLGVEEDEEWESCSAVCRIHNGFREIKKANGWEKTDNERFLTVLINHPDYIKRLPRPRLTEAEIAIMRAVGAKWVSRDENCDDGSTDLWGVKPLYGDGMYNNTEEGGLIATIRNSVLFPSVKPGDCIELEGAEG